MGHNSARRQFGWDRKALGQLSGMVETEIRPIRWSGEKLELLDQTRLPREEVTVEVNTYQQAIEAIRNMRVRGAPAIGVTAAYAVALAAREIRATEHPEFMAQLEAAAAEIGVARPTAVNLQWAVRRMLGVAGAEGDVNRTAASLLDEAKQVHREDEEINRRMGDFGKELIPDGGSVLTH